MCGSIVKSIGCLVMISSDINFCLPKGADLIVLRVKDNTLSQGNTVVSVSFANFHFRMPSLPSTILED